MRTDDDSIFLIYNQQTGIKISKMTKARTAMFLGMFIFACCLILSLTDAYPTLEPGAVEDNTKLGNNSKLVITHVVKTIEFEVGIVDDDGVVDENSTDSNASEFYETDIQLLNVDLLKEVVNQADAEENREANVQPVGENQQNGENTEQSEQPLPNLLLPLNSEV